MTNVIVAALALGIFATGAGEALEHRTRIDHATGTTDVHYRGDVAIAYKQTGAVAPGGAASSLRCHWKANVVVNREARHASGHVVARSFATPQVIEGSRPGWCATSRDSIAREVAQRSEDVRRHLMAAAEEDHPVLTAELDRLHGSAKAG